MAAHVAGNRLDDVAVEVAEVEEGAVAAEKIRQISQNIAKYPSNFPNFQSKIRTDEHQQPDERHVRVPHLPKTRQVFSRNRSEFAPHFESESSDLEGRAELVTEEVVAKRAPEEGHQRDEAGPDPLADREPDVVDDPKLYQSRVR